MFFFMSHDYVTVIHDIISHLLLKFKIKKNKKNK